MDNRAAATSHRRNVLLLDEHFSTYRPLPIGRWHRRSLPAVEGETQFVTGRICSDISITRSNCWFRHPYHSSIRYPEPMTLLVFGLRGCTEFAFADSTASHRVEPGDVWVMQTSDAHLIRRTPAGEHSEMAVIKYASGRIRQAFGAAVGGHDIPALTAVRVGRREFTQFWISRLVNNPLDSPADRLLAEGHCLELIGRWITPIARGDNREQQRLFECDRRKIHCVIERLASDLVTPPSLEALAADVGMSHTRLNRCFRHLYGQTVFDWLREYRLEQAWLELRRDRFSITDIAFMFGFSSASHFAQSFRKRYGCTPSALRRGGATPP